MLTDNRDKENYWKDRVVVVYKLAVESIIPVKIAWFEIRNK